jgi:hypothetical protein
VGLIIPVSTPHSSISILAAAMALALGLASTTKIMYVLNFDHLNYQLKIQTQILDMSLGYNFNIL